MSAATKAPRENVVKRLPLKAQAAAREVTGWEDELLLDQYGKAKPILSNVMLIMTEHPAWRDLIAFDAFRQTVVSLKPPPVRDTDRPVEHCAGEWSDNDSIRTAAWISQAYRINVAVATVDSAVAGIAERHIIHPIRDYLSALVWDGTQRLPTMFSQYFGAEQTPYAAAIGIRSMIGCIARVMRPGCKLDTVIVLEGEQGLLKSTAIEVLAKNREWYSDSTVVIGDKDAFQNLRGKWLYELPELAAIKGPKDVEKYKAYFSSADDNYRASYGKRNKSVARQCAFWATTNEDIYLLDKTGNRRFWPIKCTLIDIEGLRAVVDQLWAEAVARFELSEAWWIETKELAALCREQQEAREQVDPWVQFVYLWTSAETVLLHTESDDNLDRFDRVSIHDGLTTADLLRGAIRMPPERIDLRAEMRMGAVMHHLKWQRRQIDLKTRSTDGKRVREWRYFPPVVTTVTKSTLEGGDA